MQIILNAHKQLKIEVEKKMQERIKCNPGARGKKGVSLLFLSHSDFQIHNGTPHPSRAGYIQKSTHGSIYGGSHFAPYTVKNRKGQPSQKSYVHISPVIISIMLMVPNGKSFFLLS